MDYVYDIEEGELLPVRVEEPRASLPILIMMWEWRILFLNALFGTNIELPPTRISKKKREVPFGEHLADQLLDYWKNANRVSSESTLSKVFQVTATSGVDLIPAVAPVHTWYLPQIHEWPNEGPAFSLLEAEIMGQPERDVLHRCWTETEAFLKRYHLDGYTSRFGSRANVPWIREVISLTLDAWTNAPPPKEEWAYYLPIRVAAAIESGRNNESVATEDLCEETRNVFDLESTDTLKNHAEVKQFYSLPDRIELELPKFFPFDEDAQWTSQVKDIFAYTAKRHIAHQKEEARRCGAVVSRKKKRQFSHFEWFAEYQVGSRSYTQVGSTVGALQKAISSVSELIGLPPKRSPRGRPPTRTR
jgi:hypothetical protein